MADGTTGISSQLRALEQAHGRLRKPLSTVTNLVGGRPRVGPAEESGEMMDARRRARVFLESLPPERYPRLVEAAAPLSECDDPDAYYAFGLVLLLAGIEAKAARKR